jgi:hypothetical protein
MHYEYINWERWREDEIEYYSNGCGSARGILRPPYARQYSNICNRHDIRYMCGWSIFDKLKADFILFAEMFLTWITRYFERFGLWNIFRIFLSFFYFIWVWFFWTIIDFICFFFLWKQSAFAFWEKKKRSDFII